jgi:hypothetical protein
MALPNLNAPTKVEGKNASLAITTTPTAIISNAAASGKTLRVNILFVANIDGASAADVTIDIYDGTTPYAMVSTVSVPADATLDIIGERPLYVMEGQSLRLTASADGDLEAVCSYEEIS